MHFLKCFYEIISKSGINKYFPEKATEWIAATGQRCTDASSTTPLLVISRGRRSAFYKIGRRSCISPSRVEAEEPHQIIAIPQRLQRGGLRSARWVIDERGGASKAVTTTVTISLARSLTIEREKTVMIRD